MATIIKGSTKRGKCLIARTENYEGYYITDVYKRPSTAKMVSWQECFNKYCNTTNAHDFHVCSHNTFNYSVAWEGIYEGNQAIFIETRDNSYIVLLYA